MKRTFAAALALAATAACGSKQPTATDPLLNNGSPSDDSALATAADGTAAGMTDGALWTCQISDYDPQPCKLSRKGDGWTLRKLMGSQRFRGAVTFTPDAMGFDGEFFCPWGSCDEPMKVTFQRDAEGRYTTDFGGDQITVEWNEAFAGEYGGAGYGALTGDEQ